jgi:tetratricopeptide (TPR) repeat protein
MVEDQSGGSEEWLGLAEAELEIAVILQHCAPGTAAEGASRAAVHARNATLLAPGDPRAQALLGLCLQAAGQSREAEECVDRARQGNSNDLRLRRLCMRADALAGRAERAFMDLRALLKEDETLLRDMQTDVCMMPLAAVPEFRKLLSQWARQGLLDEHGIYCRVSAT